MGRSHVKVFVRTRPTARPFEGFRCAAGAVRAHHPPGGGAAGAGQVDGAWTENSVPHPGGTPIQGAQGR